MKKLFIFMILLLCINHISAIELSVYPIELKLSGQTNENLCGKFFISSNLNGTIIVEDRWAKKEQTEKNLNVHTLPSQELNINLNYPKEFQISQNGEFNVCIKTENPGIYHGAILFKSQQSSFGIGSWILLNITGESKNSPLSTITGKAIELMNKSSSKINFYLILAEIIFIILILTLLLILRRIRKTK